MAGDWHFVVTLDGEVIHTEIVRAQCGKGKYQHDGYCHSCPKGAVCDGRMCPPLNRPMACWRG